MNSKRDGKRPTVTIRYFDREAGTVKEVQEPGRLVELPAKEGKS